MCIYKKLHHNKNGYVVWCTVCRHFQVAFGSTILAYTEDQFYDFIRTVDEYYKTNRFYTCRAQKMVQIPTNARFVTLVYSLEELRKLLELLHQASDKLDKEKLFAFHNN